MKKTLLLFFALISSVGVAWADKTVYLNPSGAAGVDWAADNAVFAAWVWEAGSDGRWVVPTSKLTKAGTTYYKFIVNDDDNMINFHRAGSYENAKTWDNYWNATGEIGFSGKDLVTITGWDNTTTTSAWNPYAGSTFKTIYFYPSIWDAGDVTETFAAYVYAEGYNNDWFAFTQIPGTQGYSAQIPSEFTGLIFGRLSENAMLDFGNCWNQTVDYSVGANNTIYYITSFDGGEGGKSTAATSTNLSLIGGATASSGTASNANDGNLGTRWESAFSDPQWWQLDLGESKTFNTITIVWEAAYAKSFTIEVGNNVDGSGNLTDGTTVASISGQTLANLTQTLSFPATSARYVRFNGTARATGYGYSFYEFEVSNKEAGDLSTLTLSTPFATAGSSITAAPQDAEGIYVEGATYTFSPSTNVSASGNTITFGAEASGSYTVTATKYGHSAIATVYVVSEAAPAAKQGTTPANDIIFYNSTTPGTWSAAAGDEITFTGGEKAKMVHLSNNSNVSMSVTTEIKMKDNNRASIAIFPLSTFNGAVVVNPENANKFHDFSSLTPNEWNVFDYDITNEDEDHAVATFRVINNSGSAVDVLIANAVVYYKDPASINVIVVNGYATVTGTVNASNKSELNDASYSSVKAFDLAGATVADGTGIIETQSVNAVVIVKEADEEKLAGTKNLCHIAGGNWMVFPKNSGVAQTVTFSDTDPLYTGKIYAKDNDITYIYERTFSGYATFSFPAAVTVPDGVEVYAYDHYADNKLTFTKVNASTLDSNTPYVLYAASSATISYSGSATAENGLDMGTPGTTGSDVVFTANYGVTVTDGSQWVLSNGEVSKGNGAKIGSFRAYFTGLTASARAAFIDGETTKIGMITANGEMEVGEFYNLRGQRVQNPTKGLYIVNGKKVVIK